MKTVIATTVLVVVMGATYGFSAPGRHGSALRAAREAKEQPLLELRGICMNIMKPIGTKRSIMIRTMMTAMSTMMTTRGTMMTAMITKGSTTVLATTEPISITLRSITERGTMVIRTMMTAMSTMMTTRGTMVIRTMMTAMSTMMTTRGTMVIRTMMTAMRTKGSTTVLATTEPISMMLRKIMAVMSITMVILLSLSPLPHDCFGDNKDDGEGDNDSEKDY
nr:uncharacterized protein LOC113811977 isoform X5 [Penaeus vannamei]